MKHNLTMGLMAVLLAVGWSVMPVTAYDAPMRTWTSVSGATVEARYIAVERGEIVLQGADGMEFTIRPDLLSAADQQYVRDQLGIQPDAPTEQPTATKPGTLDSRAIQGLQLVQPDTARMIGLQTGAGASEVVYLILDQSRASDVHDILHVYQPGATGPQRLRKINDRARRHDGQRYVEFHEQNFSGQYGQTRAEHAVTVSSGAVRNDLIWIKVTSTYTTGPDSADIEFVGAINSEARTGPGDIPVMPLAMEFSTALLSMGPDTSQVHGSILGRGEFTITGPRRLLDALRIELQDKNGEVVETVRPTIVDIAAFPQARSRVYRARFTRLTPGEEYTAILRPDLGPVISVTEGRQRVASR